MSQTFLFAIAPKKRKRTDYAVWDKRVRKEQAELRGIRVGGAGRAYVPLAAVPDLCKAYDAAEGQGKANAPHGKTDTTQRKTGPDGLANMGNTCYINAILQCLLSNWRVASLFGPEGVDGKAAQGDVSKALQELAARGAGGTGLIDIKSAVAKRFPVFSGRQQQDAHEFLRVTLNALHEEQNRAGHAEYKELETLPGGYWG